MRRFWTLILPALGLLLLSSPASAHCDTLDGPVVKAARQALNRGTVSLVLIWVRPGDEAEVRSLFRRVLTVRRAGGDARALADAYFMETVVRLHRAGEGEPYTGLKPAGQTLPVFLAGDRAVEAGNVAPLRPHFHGAVPAALEAPLSATVRLKAYAPNDVAAGRAYVAAYVKFMRALEEAVGSPEHPR